jgi:hypothetical protein
MWRLPASGQAEAQRMAAARQATQQAKERALEMVLAEIVASRELSDEARERLSGLMDGGGANDSDRFISRSKHGKALAPTKKE